MDGNDPRLLLARRLRALREEHWPGLKITQPQLARALGDGEPRLGAPSSRIRVVVRRLSVTPAVGAATLGAAVMAKLRLVSLMR